MKWLLPSRRIGIEVVVWTCGALLLLDKLALTVGAQEQVTKEANIDTSLDDKWQQLLSLSRSYGYSDAFITMACLLSVHEAIFLGLNSLLFALEHMGWLEPYRLQPNKRPDPKLVWNCVWTCMWNHWVVFPLAAYFILPYLNTLAPLDDPLPSGSTLAKDLFVSYLLNDTLFFWAHRGLHLPGIYKHIHKKHHEFRTPLGIAATYAHPVEDVLANIIPTLIGPMVMKSHIVTMCLWLGIRLIETIESHSGFALPWSPFTWFVEGSARHDFHHSHNVGIFGGTMVFWDWICGTDRTYWEFVEKKKKAKQSSKVD